MFIDNRKFMELREAARNGDEKAAAILSSFRNDGHDTSSLLEEYFKPKQIEEEKSAEAPIEVVAKEEEKGTDRDAMSKLERFLLDNEIEEGSEDYDEYVHEFYSMFPEEKPEEKLEQSEPEQIDPIKSEAEDKSEIDKLIDDEIEAIDGYNKYLSNLLATEMCEEKRAVIVGKIKKIIADEEEHIQILRDLECYDKDKAHEDQEEIL